MLIYRPGHDLENYFGPPLHWRECTNVRITHDPAQNKQTKEEKSV